MRGGRREFIQVLVLGGAALGVAACGGGDDGGTDPVQNTGNCTANGGKAGAITGNHGHSITIPAAHFSAGTDQLYDITGAATHPHTITLTAAQLASLAAGNTVSVTSSNDEAHTHGVTLVCA